MKLQLIKLNHNGTTRCFKTIREIELFYSRKVPREDYNLYITAAIHDKVLQVEFREGKLGVVGVGT